MDDRLKIDDNKKSLREVRDQHQSVFQPVFLVQLSMKKRQ
jgi:hypothetical protein